MEGMRRGRKGGDGGGEIGVRQRGERNIFIMQRLLKMTAL